MTYPKPISRKSIAILLASYDGEKFIQAQLESLLNQTNQDFEIFIHDDGSSDCTLSIIRDFEAKFDGRLHLLEDLVPHRGAKESFFWLMEAVEADYYMFCDQDDYWLPEKIEKSLRCLQQLESGNSQIPALVHCDLRIVDSGLMEIHPSMWRYSGAMPGLMKRFDYVCLHNIYTGCTMIFNKAARDKALPYDPRVPMHDWWMALVTTKYGRAGYIDQPLILYRQHSANVCAAGPKTSFIFKWKKAFGIMDRYKCDQPMLENLGFPYRRALRFKLLYTWFRFLNNKLGIKF